MPEHEQQQATVAGFVPAAPGRVDQAPNFKRGQMLSFAVTVALPRLFFPAARPTLPPRVSVFSPVHRFVESLGCGKGLKPLQTGQGGLALSTKGFILSREKHGGAKFGFFEGSDPLSCGDR